MNRVITIIKVRRPIHRLGIDIPADENIEIRLITHCLLDIAEYIPNGTEMHIDISIE